MDLLYAISDGSKSDMDAWTRAEVGDFFMGLWTHQDAIARHEKRLKEAQR